MLAPNPFLEKVAANALDKRRIAGRISYEDYIAAGGRSSEQMVAGLDRGSNALMRIHGITEKTPSEFFSPEYIYGKDFETFPPHVAERAREQLKDKLDSFGEKITGYNPVTGNAYSIDRGIAALKRKAIALPEFDDKNYLDAKSGTANRALTRRHEVDEIRTAPRDSRGEFIDGGPKTLKTQGHSSPKVITREHENLMRLSPEVTKNGIIDVRYSPDGEFEAQSYGGMSGGKFQYGRRLNDVPGPTMNMKKFWKNTQREIADPYDSDEISQAVRNHFINLDPDIARFRQGILSDANGDLLMSNVAWQRTSGQTAPTVAAPIKAPPVQAPKPLAPSPAPPVAKAPAPAFKPPTVKPFSGIGGKILNVGKKILGGVGI